MSEKRENFSNGCKALYHLYAKTRGHGNLSDYFGGLVQLYFDVIMVIYFKPKVNVLKD